MTTTQQLQTLQDELRKALEQGKSTQGVVQQLRNAKKEADISRRRHDALSSLRSMLDCLAKLQSEMMDSEERLEQALRPEASGEGPQDGQQAAPEEQKPSETKVIKMADARHMSPEQQELLYQLKASRMGAMSSQNKALKTELALINRKQRLLQQRYQQTQAYAGSETLRAAHALEASLRGANLKIKGLEEELRKSQQMALRYRELYEDKERQNEAEQATSSGGTSRQRAANKPKSAPLEQQSFVGPSTNINDVVRKNECLLEENDMQRREIQRLKKDNAQLILIAKTADADRHTVFARLGTSESARQDLMKRFNKLKKENSQLSRSFTRQTSEWVDMKRHCQTVETSARWGELQAVAPHGGGERWREHYQKETSDLPRQMFPVESYGGTSTA